MHAANGPWTRPIYRVREAELAQYRLDPEGVVDLSAGTVGLSESISFVFQDSNPK